MPASKAVSDAFSSVQPINENCKTIENTKQQESVQASTECGHVLSAHILQRPTHDDTLL